MSLLTERYETYIPAGNKIICPLWLYACIGIVQIQFPLVREEHKEAQNYTKKEQHITQYWGGSLLALNKSLCKT